MNATNYFYIQETLDKSAEKRHDQFMRPIKIQPFLRYNKKHRLKVHLQS
jgi:hypothetical protein